MRAVGNLLIRLFLLLCFVSSIHAADVKNQQLFDMRVQKVDSDINRFIVKLKKDPSKSSELKSFENKLLYRLHILEQGAGGTRANLRKIHELKKRINSLQKINHSVPSQPIKLKSNKIVTAPPNDDCINATPIGEGTFGGETFTATNDGSASCGASEGSPDVWFRYVATADGRIVANSVGSDYDTVLSVHDPTINGCPGEESDEITCNDDCVDVQSCVGFDVISGNEYLIRMSGFDSETGNFVLNVAPAAGISGTVTDAGTSAPIAFLGVDIFNSSGGLVSYGYTDAAGNYTADNLTEGTYFATTNSYGEYIDELYDNIVCEPFCDPTNGTPIAVTAGEITPGIDFALDKGGTVSGTIIDEASSAPLSNVSVSIFDSNGDFFSYGYTDDNGNYTAAGLPTGSYRATTFNFSNHVDELFDDIVCEPFCDPTVGTPIPVTIGADTPNINFALQIGGSISGNITDAATNNPISGIGINIFDGNGNFSGFGYTDDAGNYITNGALLTGNYFAETDSFSNYLTELYDDIPCYRGNCDPITGTPIPVIVGSDTPNINFALQLGGSISGIITDAVTASPIPGVVVNIFDDSGNFSAYGYTDESGNYTSRGGLLSGNYFAVTDNYANYIDELYDDIPCPDGNCDPTTGTPIPVIVGSTTSKINFGLNFDCSNTTIIVDPATLPDGTVDVPYNQTITASGGSAPYTFAITSGALPAGLTLASDGNLTGTPTTVETATFTITATDSNGCSGSQAYSLTIAGPPFLFSDDFEDGVLATGWIYRGTWSETAGNLVGSHPGRGFAIAKPAFAGCTMCTVSTTMQTIAGGKVSLLAWHTGNSNYVELIMKEDKDRWVLKQRDQQHVVAKTKFKQVIDPGISYAVDVSFDGTNFQVLVNGTSIITMPAAATPFGTVGFKIKSTTGTFGFIQVQ
jgi:hypothetical protein